ncbi:unnamed protein product [Oreochromis niloticus]|nr:unnamed protein product [Mustela putorius furo]
MIQQVLEAPESRSFGSSSRSDIFLLIKEMLAYILCTALAVLPLLIYFQNPYFLKDLHCTFLSIYVGIRLSRIEKKFYSILDRFLDKVAEHPHKKFIVYEESSYTYSQADRESNKVARALLTHAHLKEGDTVALFLGNEPWFVWIWLALSKLGCTASFLNVNIRSKSLLHCFSCCEAKVLIAGADLQGAIEEVLPTLKQQGIRVFILREHCHVDGIESLSDKIQMESDEPLSRQLRASINIKSPAVYIYTSGTTGLTQKKRSQSETLERFCVEVPRGETGLLVAKIGKRTPFSGYAKHKQQTDKKKLRDVFEKGDVYFNSGDLLKIDDEGFIFFQDRIGDTFRWKGENVATTEVADHLLAVDFVEEANVYGVKVPGHEGRIGMAALKLKENMDFDGKAFYQHVKNYLPSYARPRFVRIQDALVVTSTFKCYLPRPWQSQEKRAPPRLTRVDFQVIHERYRRLWALQPPPGEGDRRAVKAHVREELANGRVPIAIRIRGPHPS